MIPNYRLAPQVSGKVAFQDCEEAYDWSVGPLVDTMASQHDVRLDSSRVVAMGHSAGGTIALHIGATKPVKALTAFYPSLYLADTTTSAHKPCDVPPFNLMPDYEPSAEDWKLITPEGHQLSESPLAVPGTLPSPRNRWQMNILKKGTFMATLCPDGDFATVDPMAKVSGEWPPVMIVQGDLDHVPGSDLQLVRRAEREMKAAGVEEVVVKVVPGETHMFDLPPTVGTSDLGPKWLAVIEGLSFLRSHT